jgi:hypothetical protein
MSEDTPVYAPAPIHGERVLSRHEVDLVNEFKLYEAKIVAAIQRLQDSGRCDQRWLKIGNTAIQQGFMAVNRAILQPEDVVEPDIFQTAAAARKVE